MPRVRTFESGGGQRLRDAAGPVPHDRDPAGLDGTGPVLNGDGVIVSTRSVRPPTTSRGDRPAHRGGDRHHADRAAQPRLPPDRRGCLDADRLEINRANTGTTLVVDSQLNHQLERGERIIVRRSDPGQLVEPSSTYWNTLILNALGAPPTYRDRGLKEAPDAP